MFNGETGDINAPTYNIFVTVNENVLHGALWFEMWGEIERKISNGGILILKEQFTFHKSIQMMGNLLFRVEDEKLVTLITFVSEGVKTDVTAERFGSGVLAVVVVQLALRLEALGADVADELALGRVKLRMPSQQGRFVETLVATRMLASERLC